MTRPSHSPTKIFAAVTIAFMLFAILVALGTWQVERRNWKHALIRQVEARIHAPPVPVPGPAAWAGITAEKDAYRRVVVRGRYVNDRETYVRATTVRGSGYWVMTPLRTDEGYIVLINRGFVPPAMRKAHSTVTTPTTVIGLLRITEPKGGFLRGNDAAADRWHSRDVTAIAGARSLSNVAPYFIDAQAEPMGKDTPVGGLTVVTFSDNHLVYALTWYSLSLIVLGGTVVLIRRDSRARQRTSGKD
ncbi:MAG: SURF1 family protein [Sphingobium sp.]|uniref:SURF1 family protein n=1 Tax=Sphingobium sp. TaxID=1912891 RepID=UPI0029B52B7C|nr:SURF1 family protein [Sphingobium sp.]MDX3908268.1 SURF1 family protein [Sphingobium sp.]